MSKCFICGVKNDSEARAIEEAVLSDPRRAVEDNDICKVMKGTDNYEVQVWRHSNVMGGKVECSLSGVNLKKFLSSIPNYVDRYEYWICGVKDAPTARKIEKAVLSNPVKAVKEYGLRKEFLAPYQFSVAVLKKPVLSLGKWDKNFKCSLHGDELEKFDAAIPTK